MSRVVGVHGVGQQYRGAYTLHADWVVGLKDGLARAGAALGSDDDLTCAYYGELFRPAGKSGALAPPLDTEDVTPWEAALLERWWYEAARLEPEVGGPDDKSKVGTPLVVQRALDALSSSRFFAKAATRLLVADLKQLRRYLHEPPVRRAACAALEQAVSKDTRVIVAHSLGSLVAYEALCAHPTWPVTDFVTLGSPLGIRNLVFDALEPAPVDGVGTWPAGVVRWVNIADKGDVVALVKTLAPQFGPALEDRLVDNGARVHDVARYLTSEELGHAVAAGL